MKIEEAADQQVARASDLVDMCHLSGDHAEDISVLDMLDNLASCGLVLEEGATASLAYARLLGAKGTA